MNEEALQQLYTLAQGEGYSKSFDDFKVLMSSNEDALNNMYTVSQSEGYKKSIDDFKVLVGFGAQPETAVKKKEDTESVSADGLSESQRKSKEIFEQIGGPSWRVSEEEMPLTEQSIAQMESPVDEAPSRRDVGTIQAVDFTGDRFDLKEAEEKSRIDYEPTEEEAAITSIKLSNLDKGIDKKIVTQKDIELYQEEERKEEQDIQEYKTSLIDIYNSIASQENLETISIEEYSNLFEDKSNADSKLFEEFSKQVGDNVLSQDEINEIDRKNAELISKGEEPVSYDDYIVLKKNKLFNQYVVDKNLLPSQKKERVVQNLIDVNSRILLPSKDFDFTASLNDETKRDNAKKIYLGKLKRDFIIKNISSDLYEKNEGKILTPQAYEEVYSKATKKFYNDFGEQEWETYKKISGNEDPFFIGTEYENDNQENSLINQAVVIGDEEATVANLNRLFPEFRVEGTGIAGEYITISSVAPDGGTVKSLEIYLEEENEPVRRIREFMQGAFLSKKDKAFLNKDYDTDDPLWRLEMYDYMLSNPQKFGAKDSPSMYGTKRAFETVDFDEVNQFLDRHKGKVSDEMVKSLRIKMAQADAYYKRELAQKGSMASAIGSGFMTAFTAPSKFVSNQIANVADVFGAEGAKEAKDGVISSIESMQNQVSGTTPESIAERDLLQTLLNTMTSSGGAMVLGMGNPYATFGAFLMQSSPATERLLKDEDIPEYQKGMISVLMGTVEGALESYGAQNLISPASSGLFKKLIINSIKDLPADASQETIERAIKNSVKTKLLSGGLKVAEGMIYEGATEGTQGIADDLNKRLFNTIYEKEIFQVPDWTTDEGRREWAEQIVEQVKIGALSGGGFAGAIHGTKSLAKGFQNKGDNNRFNEEYEVVMNNSTFEKRKAEFKTARAANEITEEELQVLDYQLNESREIMQSIPETLSTNRKRQAYNLLTEKRAIERVMQNKSPELVASLKDRVKDIDAQLKIVGNEEVAETPDVVEEFVKDKPSRMEKVTRYQEIENIMKPKEAEVVAEEEIIEEAPVAEETTVTEEVTEEAPVTEEERTAMQEALETQPITKITNELVAKEKKGELTQEETDGVLLGIMEKIEAENAKRKSPLSPEQAQKKLGKMQQRVFEGNKNRYLELSGVMPAAQEQVVEEAIKKETKETTTSDTEAKKAEIARREKQLKSTQEKVDRKYQEENWTEEEKEWNLKVGDELIEGLIIDIDFQEDLRTDKSKEGVRIVTKVLKKGTSKTRQKVDVGIFDSQEATDQWVKEKAERILALHQKNLDKIDAKYETEAKKAPVKEAPKRKRRKKKVTPVVEEGVKVSEEVITPIAKPKVVVSGTADGYQVVSSSNTTQAENESVKDARGDKTFDKDGFRITKLKDGSSQVSYKSKVKVSDKGNRPGYAMVTVTIPKGSPINKQQIQEAFDNKLSEIIESNRKKKLGSKFSDLTAKQSQQLTDAVVNTLSQEQVVEEAIKKETKEKPRFEDANVPVGRKTFTVTNSIEGTTKTYAVTEYLDGSEGNFREILEDGDFTNTKDFGKLKSFKDIKEVLEKNEEVSVEITKEENYKAVMNPKMFDRLTTDQQQRVDSERAKTKTKEKPRYQDSQVPVGRKTFTTTQLDNGSIITYTITEYLSGKVVFDKIVDGKPTPFDNWKFKSYEDLKEVLEKDGDFKVEIIKEEDYTAIMNPKMFDRLTTDQQQRVDSERAKTKTKEVPKRKTRRKKPVVKETPVKEAPKRKTRKKKAPVKKEAKISEEVQKEIKRAAGTRDSIVGPLKTKLDRTRGFEQKEEIRDEIQQAEKKYNNIITELKEGKRAQFQLEAETTSEQTKQKLLDIAEKLVEDVTQENNGEISEDPFTAEQPAPGAEIITIEVKENSELAKKVKKMGLGDLVGKKINLVMADQLKVDKKRMGGPFFPLIDKLFGKVAWASIDKGAASRIINGAIKSDYTVVFNMSSDGIYSNSIMGETLIELIPTEKRDEAFKLIKENILQSKSKSLKKAQGVMKVSESLEDFFKQLQNLDVDTRAAVITKLLPSKKVDTVQTEVGKFLIENNISLEGLVEANAEDFAANLPTGAMTMVLEVTDKAGNKITEETKDEAFITPEQQKEEGLPQHPNYPMYIRGKAVGILTETTPFWNVIKDVGEKINQKIEGIIQRRQGFREDLTQEEKNTVDNLKNGVALKGKDSITEAKRVAKVIRDTNAKNIGGPIGKVLKDNMDLIINESSIVKIREVFQDSQNIFAKYVNTTSALARKEAMRSAEMSASRAQEVSSPEASRYEKFVSVLKRSFPSVEVVTTQAEFDTLLKETGAKQLTTKGQKVYGAVYQGKLYLNPSLENYNTPIHEFGHVWMNVAKEANRKLYEKGLSLVKGSKYEQDVLNNKAYQKVIKQMRKDGASEQEINDYIQEEALATAIGDKGESFVNASRNKSFKDWLSTLYGFVRKLTGISKYTSKQLENITLDEFTQAVAVDLLSGRQLFEGAEITDMGDALQLMAEKGVDLDAAMNESINQMIDKGFKAAEIKGVLLQMGYKARAINDALVVKIDADMKLPNEFANIDGGVREGETMFRSVMQKLKEFAAPKLVKRSIKEQYKEAKKDGYEGTIKEYTEEQNNKKVEMLKEANPALAILTNEEILERYPNIQNEVIEKQQKSRAEIRAKAIELLEAEAAFQAQDNLTQLKLIESLDRTMKTRSNKEVQKRISAIKQALKGVREGVKDLQAAKKRIKNLIREELLPIGVTTAEANKLIRTIEKATKETYESSVAEVMQVVDRQISRKRKSLINEMLKLAKQKSKVKNKRARTSPEAARFFKQATVILNALSKNNTEKLETIEEQLRKKETEINEIIDKINDGAKVTAEQQKLVALAQAFDILGSLNKQDLSETQDALNLMKSELESGMESLRTRRAARKAIYDRLREEAYESIKDGYEFLFDKDGKPLTPGEVTNKRQQIKREIFKGKELVKNMRDYYKLALKPNLKFFANYLKHLGTITNGLDRKGDFFKKNIYDRLNNMEESYLQGYFNSIDLLSSELEAIGIKGGYDGLSRVINDSLVKNQIKTISGIKLDLDGVSQNVSLTKGEAMRIYALSKNAEQRKRLEKQGFTPAKMQQIEEFLGEQLVQATDRVVDFLAEHYEGVNQVYESVNDVSLPYIENYFPTKTQIKSAAAKEELESLEPNMNSGNVFGVFSAQFASALKERSSEDAIQIKSEMGELDFSSVLEQHLRSTERFKAYAQGTKEINVIINSTPSVTTLLKATNLKSTLTNGIMYAINPDAIKQYYELKNPWISKLQRKFVGVTLALKFIQLPKQASSFVNAFADYQLRKDNRIPGVDTALDIIGFGLDTAYTLLTFRSTYREAMKSASFRNRIRESFKTADLLGLEAGIGSAQRTRKTKLGRALRKAKVIANSPTLVGDVMGVMGYMSAQRANKRNGMSEQEAIEKFNAYNETQQTRRPTEKIGLQTSNNIIVRSFTIFGSTFYLQLNKIMQAVTNIRRDGANSLKLVGKKEFKEAYKQSPTNKDYRELLLNLAGANFLFTAIANAFKYNPFMDDDDEITEEEMERIKKAQNALKKGKEVSDEDMKLIERYQFQLDKNAVIKQYQEALSGLNIFYNLPLIGPTTKGVMDYAWWDDPNVDFSKVARDINPLNEIFQDVKRDKEWNNKSWWEASINPLISFSMGIPVEKPLALVDRIQSMYGDDEMYREGYEELNDDGERKFKGTFEEYKAEQMEKNMYELMGISYSYRPGSGKDWTKKKMTITIDPKTGGKEEESSSKPRKRTRRKRTR